MCFKNPDEDFRHWLDNALPLLLLVAQLDFSVERKYNSDIIARPPLIAHAQCV